MDNSSLVEHPPVRRRAAGRVTTGRLPLATTIALFLAAAVSQFVIGPGLSPGFTYLAVVLALGGLGTLLAHGLKAEDSLHGNHS